MTAALSDPVRRFLEGETFEADPFQIDAIRAIERGASVVVTAPTGSGKTLIAEAALEIALADGKRAFYTAPIKALSNQKYRDLVARYGEAGTGLLTGDNSINGDAPVVVMTTEVLRNMIYADADALDGLGVVILDEVHYLQDRYRGSVWEEIIIHLSRGIQLVNLSATIANPEEFAGWVQARRGFTELVVETHRPVPLESMYLIRDRHHGNAVEWFPVFDRTGSRPNRHVTSLLRKEKGRRRRFATPRRLEVAEALIGAGKLPAIYFIFSRAGCERAARETLASGLRLSSADERSAIREVIAEKTAHLDPADLTVLGYDSWSAMLESGVAAHHAGMVPAFKESVEELFGAGLIKLVFATETLSLGINMPAKAVVLESFSKFNGESHELLRAGDYTQLTGRAGRRGIDRAGTAVVLHSSYVPFDRIADVAGMGSHPLVSSFEPSYNMAVNLIANYRRERAEELLRASFAQFRAQERRRLLDQRIADRKRDVTEFLESAQCDRGDIEEFAATARKSGAVEEETEAFFAGLDAGDVLDLGEGEPLVILARSYGPKPRFLLLARDGEEQRRRVASLGRGVLHLGHMPLEEPIRSSDAAYRDAAARSLRSWEPIGNPRSPFAIATTAEGIAACPQLDEHLRWLSRSRRAAKDVRRLERRRKRSKDDVVQRFNARTGVLARFKYVDGWELSPKGQNLRRIYTELDLVLSEAIDHGVFDGLSVPEFAAVVSTFTYEPRRADPVGADLVGVVAERFAIVESHARVLTAAEEPHGIEPIRSPDPGFAPFAYGWAAGADLEALYGDDAFSAGDFVRNCRQLLDLTRQIRDAYPALAPTAAGVVTAVDRGIVAVGGRV